MAARKQHDYAGSMEEESEHFDDEKESGCDVSDDGSEDVDEEVQEDMVKFQESFKDIGQRYRLINVIGEGTFSTVYKAEDLLYDHYRNDWDVGHRYTKSRSQKRRSKFVAIKKIYVTSSPSRIINELELLHELQDAGNVCPLITAFRHQDQVIAILPFFEHQDFRDYYRKCSVTEMAVYFHSLITALKFVHECEILHRDIKPTNFLYSPSAGRGVLVDFGLAERNGTDSSFCLCTYASSYRQRKVQSSVYTSTLSATQAAGEPAPRPTYPNIDQRPSRRANRAGTRGFRAPEVLLKCPSQSPVIDIWSCGIILLTFLSQRFPFFHSADDIDAFLELCCVFGKKKMKAVALLHGQVMQTNIPTITENGHGWEKVLLWCTNRPRKDSRGKSGLSPDELEAVKFMECCLELDPMERITAEEALEHPFLQKGKRAMTENNIGRLPCPRS